MTPAGGRQAKESIGSPYEGDPPRGFGDSAALNNK